MVLDPTPDAFAYISTFSIVKIRKDMGFVEPANNPFKEVHERP
jgi:hypothetical protein